MNAKSEVFGGRGYSSMKTVTTPLDRPQTISSDSLHISPFAVAADQVVQNTVVADITHNPPWLNRTRWLTAQAYMALADPKLGIGLEDVFAVVSADIYDQEGRSRTFATLTTDPQSGATRISASLRVVIGQTNPENTEVPAIDAMNFMVPARGWPHQQEAWADSEIAEIGRFFTLARYRTLPMRRAGVDVWLLSMLFAAATAFARSQQVRICYAIAPPYVIRLLDRFGARTEQIESKLNTADPFTALIFEQFSLYWQHACPKLYHFPEIPVPRCVLFGSTQNPLDFAEAVLSA